MNENPELNKQVSPCCGAEIRPNTLLGRTDYDCRNCGKFCTPIPAPSHQQEAAGNEIIGTPKCKCGHDGLPYHGTEKGLCHYKGCACDAYRSQAIPDGQEKIPLSWKVQLGIPLEVPEQCPHGCTWKHQPEHWHYRKKKEQEEPEHCPKCGCVDYYCDICQNLVADPFEPSKEKVSAERSSQPMQLTVKVSKFSDTQFITLKDKESEAGKGWEFMECDTCFGKAGSPRLCDGCFHNRETILVLAEQIAKARAEGYEEGADEWADNLKIAVSKECQQVRATALEEAIAAVDEINQIYTELPKEIYQTYVMIALIRLKSH